jgi:hypothetical protein
MIDEIIEYQVYTVMKDGKVHRHFRDHLDAAYCAIDVGGVALNPKILEHSYEGVSQNEKDRMSGAIYYMHKHVKVDAEKVRLDDVEYTHSRRATRDGDVEAPDYVIDE